MAHATAAGILSIVLIALHGCAMTNATTPDAFRNTLTGIPAADPVLDHYIAWVPLKQAQTAGVARAIHIYRWEMPGNRLQKNCAGSIA